MYHGLNDIEDTPNELDNLMDDLKDAQDETKRIENRKIREVRNQNIFRTGRTIISNVLINNT